MAIEQLERPQAASRGGVAPRTDLAVSSRAAPVPSPAPIPVVRVGLQVALGYEWLASGLDKLLYGHFPAALGGLLAGVLRGGAVPALFAALLRAVALPHAALFGWLVQWGETLAGLALLAAGLGALLRPVLERHLAPAARSWLARARAMVGALALAAAAGTVLLGLSFYLLDGVPPFWPLPSVAFGGAVDTGLLLAALAAPLLLAPLVAWLRRR